MSEFIEHFRVAYGIFGIGGISSDGDLLDYDFRDIGVSRTAMRISKKRFFALDHSKFEADAAVVVAYGLILPKPVLDAPVHGCLNLHASLHYIQSVKLG